MGCPPYTAVLRLWWYWKLSEADLNGRLTLAGITVEEEPLCTALDLIYSLWVDDLTPVGESRAAVRGKLDDILARSVSPEADGGLSAEAVEAGERADAMFERWARTPVEGEP
jgi:hypothetical protein